MTRISGLSKALERYINQVRTELSASQYGALRNFVDDFRSADNELQEFKTRIAELEAENARLKAERRWIPCTERLPKTSPVLVLTVNGEITSGMLTDGIWTNPRFDFSKDNVACWHEFCDELPLPELPERGEE